MTVKELKIKLEEYPETMIVGTMHHTDCGCGYSWYTESKNIHLSNNNLDILDLKADALMGTFLTI